MKGSIERIARVTYDLTPEAKHKLASMKNDLRLQGYRVTERAIILALISAANLETIVRLLKPSQGDTQIVERLPTKSKRRTL